MSTCICFPKFQFQCFFWFCFVLNLFCKTVGKLSLFLAAVHKYFYFMIDFITMLLGMMRCILGKFKGKKKVHFFPQF